MSSWPDSRRWGLKFAGAQRMVRMMVGGRKRRSYGPV